MSSKEILLILKDYKKEKGHDYGIIDLGIFGSTARGEDNEDSDIDVVIRFQRPNLFDMAGIKFDLEERLLKTVDLVSYRENMNLFLKQRIDKDAVYV
ncbi:MAG: nucleotidyltransferase domain-containing protein [Deltaproteobacteria bacterium]|nr:nucleotidyltransferase domain-containing protein [Deltaproteobacteria bacterium]